MSVLGFDAVAPRPVRAWATASRRRLGHPGVAVSSKEVAVMGDIPYDRRDSLSGDSQAAHVRQRCRHDGAVCGARRRVIRRGHASGQQRPPAPTRLPARTGVKDDRTRQQPAHLGLLSGHPMSRSDTPLPGIGGCLTQAADQTRGVRLGRLPTRLECPCDGRSPAQRGRRGPRLHEL